ncbi:unnamed protein product, partial [Oppiella nova]
MRTALEDKLGRKNLLVFHFKLECWLKPFKKHKKEKSGKDRGEKELELSMKLLKRQQLLKIYKDKKILTQADYQVIRAFIEGQLERNELPDNSLKYYGNLINKLTPWLASWQTSFRNNFCNKGGETALHVAFREGNVKVKSFILNSLKEHPRTLKKLINAKDNYGETVLHRAAESDKWDVVKLLVNKGADVNAKNRYGSTVLHFAAKSDKWDVVKWLVEQGADVNAKDKDGETVLYWAARDDNWEVVKLLVNKGADVNAKLYWAVREGKWDVVKLLVNKGADVNAKDSLYITVLYWAAREDKWDVVKWLVNKGADVNAKGNYGETVLHQATKSGQLDVAKWLVEQEADVNAKDNLYITVLYWAAWDGKWDVVKLLVEEKGADVNSLTREQKERLLDNAKQYGWQNIVDKLSVVGIQQIQSQSKQQKAFLHLGKYVSHHFFTVKIEAIKQGLYLPVFESRGVKINGKCASITRAVSQLLFLKDASLNFQQLFLSNLQVAAELYERLAQGKQISSREEKEIFALSSNREVKNAKQVQELLLSDQGIHLLMPQKQCKGRRNGEIVLPEQHLPEVQ